MQKFKVDFRLKTVDGWNDVVYQKKTFWLQKRF